MSVVKHIQRYAERWTCVCCEPESSPETYTQRLTCVYCETESSPETHTQRWTCVYCEPELSPETYREIQRDGHVSVVNLNHHLKHIQRDIERWTYVCCETHTEICREMDMCLL